MQQSSSKCILRYSNEFVLSTDISLHSSVSYQFWHPCAFTIKCCMNSIYSLLHEQPRWTCRLRKTCWIQSRLLHIFLPLQTTMKPQNTPDSPVLRKKWLHPFGSSDTGRHTRRSHVVETSCVSCRDWHTCLSNMSPDSIQTKQKKDTLNDISLPHVTHSA